MSLRPVAVRRLLALLVAASGCAGGAPATTPAPAPAPTQGRTGLAPGVPAGADLTGFDVVGLYRQMGLLASGFPMPFVGSVAYLGGRSADSTLALVTLSLANRSLGFIREGDRYAASYSVTLEARRGDAPLARMTTTETVRVTSFKETGRTDESVIFEQLLVLPPGEADITVTVRDEGSGRVGTAIRSVVVPTLTGRSALGTPVPFYQATLRPSLDTLPRLVPSPRSTVVFGRDSVVPVYLEAYGPGDRVTLRARVETEGATLFVDSLPLVRRTPGLFSGVFTVPVRRLGIGVTTIAFARTDAPADTASVPVFVSFGDDLPVASFEQMLNYLRYFASPTRIRALREVAPEQRAEAWARFVTASDPAPITPEHEGLRQYFQRIQTANLRFRDEGQQGWLTDRGMVYITLGEPEQVRETNPMDVGSRGRALVWDYPSRRVTLVFIDQTGFGRWRLSIQSQGDFQAIARAVQERNG
ncbi:MAG: GWxTD domain-containing protein [Gemmatimonadaceae bacterium]|jgi:GWxTD domain-containing protein|nr:GWxTD domain-containing protein [Gemmatimonadaceae bacterium]